jgi:DNA-binding transcriptional LysR family regulator
MRFVALHYFLETARLGSIRRAAEVLYVAPSALSRQIALLEEDFGAPLFERAGSGMRLTAAGQLFAEQARATLKSFERLRSDLDDLQQLRRGTVSISSMEGAVPTVLYPAMRAFTRDHPQISFEVVCGGTEAQLTALCRGECDVSIIFDPPPNPEVLVECAVDDPICAIIHAGHPLASRQSLSLADLAGERLALVDQGFVTRTRLDRAASRDRVQLPAVLTVNHALHTIAFVRQKMGITFAPRHIVLDDVTGGGLVAVPIKNPVLSRTRTALCRHSSRPLSRAAQAFLLVLKEQLIQLAAVQW